MPVMQPRLPNTESLLPYLTRIDQSRVYSNFGPLHQELSDRFATYFGVDSSHIALVANGTLALQAAIESIGQVGDTWVLPSWTFVASGQAILSARRRPHFVDVDLDTWAMQPNHRSFARGNLIVAPFGSAPDLDAWRSIPGHKVFDAASCFDACRSIGPKIDEASMIMVSLHATKTMPAGEGAVLIGPQPWIERAATWANFGFSGSRFSSGPGMNAKMSEYHAAVGLASLDSWSEDREDWNFAMSRAVEITNECQLYVQPSFSDHHVTSTWNVRLPKGMNSTTLASDLFQSGIESRRWWPAGVHEMPAFTGQTADPQDNTDELVRSVVGLPFGRDLTSGHFDRIAESLKISLGRHQASSI